MTALFIILTIFAGILYAEFVGYFVHKLLHSEKFPSLSTAHMLHHLRDYGPDKDYFTDEYIESTRDRAAFLGGIGFEWFLPIGICLALTIAGLTLLGVPAAYQVLMVISGLFWGYVGFSYIHGALHLKKFWMLENRFFKRHFLEIRKLHLIHHQNVFEDGRMMTNFGICFYWFDRVFGTYARKVFCDTKKGFQAAQKTYSYIYK